MFVGKDDDLADPEDARWAREEIRYGGNALVEYYEFNAGHASFMIGKDMSYFNRVIDLVQKYNV